MAVAAHGAGDDARKVVAVIGDGAMSAGMAFEALNNAGAADADLLVVLNDNDMSISPAGGRAEQSPRAPAVAAASTTTSRRGSKEMLSRAATGAASSRSAGRRIVKGMVLPGTMFEELGFNYIGPIDGHDLDALVPTLPNLRELEGPQFLHVVTRKGHGYAPAEADPMLYHGVTRFDPAAGIVSKPPAQADLHADLRRLALRHGRARCAADRHHARDARRFGLVRFSREFPDRYFDVGIAEQHAVTFAAGLACEGMKPVVAIYSTFLQRGYDQLIHDVALQNLPVRLRHRPRGHRRGRRRDAPRRVRSHVPALPART